MRGIDLQMAFSLNKQADMKTAMAAASIDRCLPYRAFVPSTQEFPDAISDAPWYGKGNSYASFWDPITKQVMMPSREFSLSNLSALFAPAMVMGKVEAATPGSGAGVYKHRFTFQDPLASPEPIYTAMIEKMGSIYQRLISGAVIEQFTLTGVRTDHVTIAWQGFARKMVTDATALPEIPDCSFFKTIKGTFNFGATGAAANVSAQLVSWNLTVNQNPSKWWMPGNAAGEENLLTKCKIGKQSAIGQIVILLEDANQKTLFENNSECELTILLVGDKIGATDTKYQVEINIPHLKIPSEAFGEEQEQVTYTIPFTENTILKDPDDDYLSIEVQCDENDAKLLVAA